MTTFNENLNFHYPQQMQYLYENSMRISHDLLREILALPQNELLDDLEMVLKDAQNRYKEIVEICDNLETEEFLQYSTFAFHAVMLLGEINCKRSLDLALNFLKRPDNEEFNNRDFIGFYIGDIITEDLWMVFYRLGIGREQKLCDFFFFFFIDEFTKCPACNALQQIALHHKEKTKEIQGYYEEALRRFVESEFYEDENLNDVCQIVTLIVGAYMETLPDPISPHVKTLYDLGLVCEGGIGTYEKLIEDVEKYSKYSFREVVDIFTFYENAVKKWYCYNKDKPDFDDDKWIKPQQPDVASKTTGRNDPCPCGSGKKYKKCCLGKEL
jgi:tetratricopeptide (TPR) repeat protein